MFAALFSMVSGNRHSLVRALCHPFHGIEKSRTGTDVHRGRESHEGSVRLEMFATYALPVGIGERRVRRRRSEEGQAFFWVSGPSLMSQGDDPERSASEENVNVLPVLLRPTTEPRNPSQSWNWPAPKLRTFPSVTARTSNHFHSTDDRSARARRQVPFRYRIETSAKTREELRAA